MDFWHWIYHCHYKSCCRGIEFINLFPQKVSCWGLSIKREGLFPLVILKWRFLSHFQKSILRFEGKLYTGTDYHELANTPSQVWHLHYSGKLPTANRRFRFLWISQDYRWNYITSFGTYFDHTKMLKSLYPTIVCKLSNIPLNEQGWLINY